MQQNVRDRIAAEIQATSVPVFLIHLGDIYYSGTRSECLTFLRNWPLRDASGPIKGRSFSLNGNHEMYSGGDGFFNVVLPAFGQKASYFVLRSPKWDFYGLDTAYVSGCFHTPEGHSPGRSVEMAAKPNGRGGGPQARFSHA